MKTKILLFIVFIIIFFFLINNSVFSQEILMNCVAASEKNFF